MYTNVKLLCTITFQVYTFNPIYMYHIYMYMFNPIYMYIRGVYTGSRMTYKRCTSMYNHVSNSRIYVVSDPIYTPRVYTYIGEQNLGVYIKVVRLCTITFQVYTFASIYVYLRGVYTGSRMTYKRSIYFMYVQSRFKCVHSLEYTCIYRVYIRGVYTGSRRTNQRSKYFYVQSRFKCICSIPYTRIYGVHTRGSVWHICSTSMYNHVSSSRI